MVVGTTRDLFTVIAESSATLTGLLFVAMSLAPRREESSHLAVVHQVRAAAALLAFTGALSISLFGLVDDNNVGYPASVVGVIGLAFTAAGMRSILDSTNERRLIRKQLGLVLLLLLTFGFELGDGIALIANSQLKGALDVLSNVLVASLLIGVARAWEMVGERDTSFLASVAVLSRRARHDEGGQTPPSR